MIGDVGASAVWLVLLVPVALWLVLMVAIWRRGRG